MKYQTKAAFKEEKAPELANLACDDACWEYLDETLGEDKLLADLMHAGVEKYFDAQRGSFENPRLCDQLKGEYLGLIEESKERIGLAYMSFETDFPASDRIAESDKEKLTGFRDYLYGELRVQGEEKRCLLLSWFWNNALEFKAKAARLRASERKIIREFSRGARDLAALYLRGDGQIYENAHKNVVNLFKKGKAMPGRLSELTEEKLMLIYDQIARDLQIHGNLYREVVYQALYERCHEIAQEAGLDPEDTKTLTMKLKTTMHQYLKDRMEIIEDVERPAPKKAKGKKAPPAAPAGRRPTAPQSRPSNQKRKPSDSFSALKRGLTKLQELSQGYKSGLEELKAAQESVAADREAIKATKQEIAQDLQKYTQAVTDAKALIPQLRALLVTLEDKKGESNRLYNDLNDTLKDAQNMLDALGEVKPYMEILTKLGERVDTLDAIKDEALRAVKGWSFGQGAGEE